MDNWTFGIIEGQHRRSGWLRNGRCSHAFCAERDGGYLEIARNS
jgi:hypothetical protein